MSELKLGINLWSQASAWPAFLAAAKRADELGYSSIKTVEHSFYDYGGHSPNPCVFLSALAARRRGLPHPGALRLEGHATLRLK